MPIQLRCDQCQSTLRVPDTAEGKRIKCPRCSCIIQVESKNEEAEQSAEPSPSVSLIVPAQRKPTPVKRQSMEINSQPVRVLHITPHKTASHFTWAAITIISAVMLTAFASVVYWIGQSTNDTHGQTASDQSVEPTSPANPIGNTPDAPNKTLNDSVAASTELNPALAAVPDPGAAAISPAEATSPGPIEGANPPVSVQETTPQNVVKSSVTFEPLLLDEPATSLTISEDGRFVIMSHQAAGLVSVYDVVADKVTHVIHTTSPRALLSRGDQLFVGNFGEGKISVFSASNAWKLQNEVQVTKPNIVFMSAACQQNFAGEILVTCHGDGGQASYQDSAIFLVDVQRDRCKAVSPEPMASVGFDGKTVLTQSSFNLSPSGGLRVYSYDEFVAGDPTPIYQGGIQQTPFVYQSYSGSYWLSENMVFGGAPIALVHEKLGSIVIPDTMQKVIYVMDEDLISARQLNSNLTEIPEKPRRVTVPPEQMKPPSRLFHQLYRRRGYFLDHPVAATHGNLLTLCLLDQTNGAVLRARTPAFLEPAKNGPVADAPAISSHLASDSTPPAVVPTPATVNSTASGIADILRGWPTMISVGREFRHQFPVEKGKLDVQLVDGPSGMKISADGVLTWLPTNKDTGSHEFKLRFERSAGPFFERPQVEVVSEELAKSVKGDLTKVNQFESFDLDTDHYAIAAGLDRKSLLLLQGKTLRILGPNGISVARKIELPQRYHDIEERQDVYVAVSSKPPFLDIIDKKSLKIRNHIDLVFPDFKVLDVTDLAIHPDSATSYVCVKNSIELPRYTVLVVDEESGSAKAPGIIGTWAEVAPDGLTLYTGYSDIYEKGVNFHINPGWRLIEIPEYGSVDMLLAWTTSGTKPSLQKIVRQAGGNGSGIRLAPDGSRITYLSHVGTPMHANNLVGFATADFESGEVHYMTKDRASTKEAAFHPNLPWVAMPGTGSVVIFQQDTGTLIENRMLATLAGLGTDGIERLFFSPDGKSILLLRSGGESGRYLQCIPLILEDSEILASPRRQKPQSSTKAKPQVVPDSELHSLKAKAAEVPMTPLAIGRDFTNSVVVVMTSDSAGSGFIVGNNGYVLTCAHVVGDGNKMTVAYNSTGERDSFITEPAELIRIDHDNDIALVKFTPKQPLKSVRLSNDHLMETGEPVTVIGNPGAGDSILSHTMTNGIVSNPRRDVEGQLFIQLSAAVNPGNSGGPLFDQFGNVAGLIALKAKIEGAGFAVPSETLKKFLKDAVNTQ